MTPAYRDRMATNFIELARRITSANLPPTWAGVQELNRRNAQQNAKPTRRTPKEAAR